MCALQTTLQVGFGRESIVIDLNAKIAYHYRSLAIPPVVYKPAGGPERWNLMSEPPYPAVSIGGGK